MPDPTPTVMTDEDLLRHIADRFGEEEARRFRILRQSGIRAVLPPLPDDDDGQWARRLREAGIYPQIIIFQERPMQPHSYVAGDGGTINVHHHHHHNAPQPAQRRDRYGFPLTSVADINGYIAGDSD
jgi:hypothetical protein